MGGKHGGPQPAAISRDEAFILVIHTGHPHDEIYGENIRFFFEKIGIQVVELPLHRSGFEVTLKRLLDAQENMLCIISVSNHAFRFRLGQKFLNECTKVPIVLYSLDPPWGMSHCLPERKDNIILAANDLGNLEFWKRFICADTPCVLANIGQGTSPRLNDVPGDFGDYATRPITVLMDANHSSGGHSLATLGNHIHSQDSRKRERAYAAIDCALSDATVPPHEAVETVLARAGEEVPMEEFLDLVQMTEDYAKLWRRNQVLLDLLDLPVVFAGHGFPDPFVRKHPHKFIRPDMKHTMELYAKSRMTVSVLANSNSFHVHPRMLHAVSAHAALVCHRTAIVDQLFRDKHDVILFDFAKNPISEAIQRYIGNPEACYAVASNARNTLESRDLWDWNYREILLAVGRMNEQRGRASIWRSIEGARSVARVFEGDELKRQGAHA